MADKEKEVHEFYRHYRGAAVALSATIIALSGSIIYWLISILGSEAKNPLSELLKNLIWLQLLFYVLGIASALFIQFFNFLGYYHLARSYYPPPGESKDKKRWLRCIDKKESTKTASDERFSCLDKAVKFSFWIFCVGLCLSVIFCLIKYW